MHSRIRPERFMHHGHRPGARFFERGGIKFAILELVREKPRHGYEIIREMEERSGGLYSPSPGAVYPTLQALEDQELVSSTTEGGKRVYAVTEAGLSYLETHKEQARGHRERWETHWGVTISVSIPSANCGGMPMSTISNLPTLAAAGKRKSPILG